MCRVLMRLFGCPRHRAGDTTPSSQAETYGSCATMDALGDAQRNEWPLLSTRPALALDGSQDVIHLELAPPPACPFPTIPHSDEDIFPPYQSDHSFLLPKIRQKQQSGHLKPSWSVPTNSTSCFISPYVLPPWSCTSVILSYFHGVCKNVMLFACVSFLECSPCVPTWQTHVFFKSKLNCLLSWESPWLLK